MPSLKQLVDAVQAFMDEHPEDLITVVVDATFGHRIDPREIAEFDAAIEHNELVAPPAGAVGRGDAFVLAIANKVNAAIISNDSYQEFHAEYDWLFDEGRLIGGKPVPHVGWVFVPRVPVRGPLSRRVTRDAKRGKDRPAPPVKASKEAFQPMPVPAAPPPGALLPPKRRRGAAPGASGTSAEPRRSSSPAPAPAAAAAASVSKMSTHVPTPAKSAMVNELLPFLSFVEHHKVGTPVDGVVESYASHGAYLTIGDARGYVPLRLMADPAPRSAREVMKLGDTVTLLVAAFHPQRRGIDLATPAMADAIVIPVHEADEGEPLDDDTAAAAVPAKRSRKKAAPRGAAAAPVVEPPAAAEPPARVRPPGRKQRAGTRVGPAAAAAPTPAAPPVVVAPVEAVPPVAKPAKSAGRGRTSRATPVPPVPAEVVAPAAPKRTRGTTTAAKTAAAPAPAPTKRAPAKSAKTVPAAPVAPARPVKAGRAKVAAASAATAPAPVTPAVPVKKAARAKKAAPAAVAPVVAPAAPAKRAGGRTKK